MQEQLSRFAETDLKNARKHGCIGIAQTKLGLLNLYYAADQKSYKLVRCGNPTRQPETIAEGSKKAVKLAIIDSYDVVYE